MKRSTMGYNTSTPLKWRLAFEVLKTGICSIIVYDWFIVNNALQVNCGIQATIQITSFVEISISMKSWHL